MMTNVENSTTRQKLLIGSFNLFIKKNIDKVTIKDIELITGFTRGSIFYHFDTKIDIFKAVIDEMYFVHFDNRYFLNFKDTDTLNSFLMCYLNPCQRIISYIKNIQPNISAEKSFLHLTSQANIFYPNFALILKEHLTCEENRVTNFLKSKYADSLPNGKPDAISLLITDMSYSQILKSALGITTNVTLDSYFKMFFT